MSDGAPVGVSACGIDEEKNVAAKESGKRWDSVHTYKLIERGEDGWSKVAYTETVEYEDYGDAQLDSMEQRMLELKQTLKSDGIEAKKKKKGG